MRGVVAAIASLAATLGAASAGQAQTTMLGASDFTLGLSRMDPSGAYDALTADDLTNFLSAARCSCPINLGIAIAINSDSVANLGAGDVLDATVMVGSDCDNVAVTTCISLGADLTMNADTTSVGETLSTSDIFTAAALGVSCSALPATSTRIWAIIRQNGVRLTTQPSLTIGVGGAGPTAPTAVAATTADSGLLVSWTAPVTITSVQGYQVLCSPAPSTPPAAAFDTCAAGLVQGGTGPFATLDPTLICSDLVSLGTNSVRVHGLQNGTAYQIAVISIGSDGTPSPASAVAMATPGPTLGFDDLYKQDGGTGLVSCTVGGPSTGGGAGGAAATVSFMLALAWIARRRRRRNRTQRNRPARPARRERLMRLAWRSSLLGLMLWLATTHAARADEDDDPNRISHGYRFGDDPVIPAFAPSPRNWNFELRFGPYYPSVDSEFADRGEAARPFEQTFSSNQRLLSGLEIDRQILHRVGTWSVGFSFGYYNATASALAADQVTRSGDDTSLRFIPLAVMAIYRADILRERFSSPAVPYAKLGLDCALWRVSDTSKSSSTSGRTFGWNAAAGVALDLSFIDPDGMKSMDSETGVNGVSVFGEVTHNALDGFGSSSVLRLGDTTWVAGLMLEM